MALVLLAVLALTLGAGAEQKTPDARPAAGGEPGVLFLSAYSPDWSETAMQMQGLQDALGNDVSQQFVFMDTKHAGFEEAEQYTCAHLKTLCSETRFDAVVAGDDAALHFAMKYRAAFFENVPIVFMGVNSPRRNRAGRRCSAVCYRHHRGAPAGADAPAGKRPPAERHQSSQHL
jgi:hypothetical protein